MLVGFQPTGSSKGCWWEEIWCLSYGFLFCLPGFQALTEIVEHIVAVFVCFFVFFLFTKKGFGVETMWTAVAFA